MQIFVKSVCMSTEHASSFIEKRRQSEKLKVQFLNIMKLFLAMNKEQQQQETFIK